MQSCHQLASICVPFEVVERQEELQIGFRLGPQEGSGEIHAETPDPTEASGGRVRSVQ